MSNILSCAALRAAVKAGNYKKIAELLDEFGLKVDDSWIDYKLLSDAVKTENPKIVQLLLNHGCRVNKPRADVYSPLHLAVEIGHAGIVKILLKQGASVTSKCEGMTPLHITIKSRSPEIVKLLLAHKANVCAKNLDDYTPIHRAFSNRNCSRILDLMLTAHEGKLANPINSRRMSIFHIACSRNHPVVVENFLQRNIDVNECIDMNAPAWNGFTGLHFAAINNRDEVAQVLLKYRANVKQLCALGLPPLWWAFKYSFTDEIADKLNAAMSLVKNKNTTEGLGVPPLGIMMKFMSQEIRKIRTIQLLIEYKSDVNFIRNDGRPMLFEAYCPSISLDFSDDIPNLSMIKSICCTFYTETRKKTMKILISHGIDLNVVDKDKNSILHNIAEDSNPIFGSIDIAEMILTKGVETNVKNDKGDYPLHIAVKNGFSDYVYLLLKYKANPNSTDGNLRTPLHYAKEKRIIDLLINSGANANAKDGEGRTPLLNT